MNQLQNLRMLEHAMKVLERVFEERIHENVDIDEIQMDFMPGKDTIDALFAVRQLLEKYRKIGKELYFVFVDLETVLTVSPEKLFGVYGQNGLK